MHNPSIGQSNLDNISVEIIWCRITNYFTLVFPLVLWLTVRPRHPEGNQRSPQKLAATKDTASRNLYKWQWHLFFAWAKCVPKSSKIFIMMTKCTVKTSEIFITMTKIIVMTSKIFMSMTQCIAKTSEIFFTMTKCICEDIWNIHRNDKMYCEDIWNFHYSYKMYYEIFCFSGQFIMISKICVVISLISWNFPFTKTLNLYLYLIVFFFLSPSSYF